MARTLAGAADREQEKQAADILCQYLDATLEKVSHHFQTVGAYLNFAFIKGEAAFIENLSGTRSYCWKRTQSVGCSNGTLGKQPGRRGNTT